MARRIGRWGLFGVGVMATGFALVTLWTSGSMAAAARQVRAAETPVGPEVITNSIGMKLVFVSAGTFTMGSPETDADAFANEKPEHQVRIGRGFHLGQTEVTHEQYDAVMRGRATSRDDANTPVADVTWEQAADFCRRLTESERMAGTLGADEEYRLPTEAEWEFACRVGTNSAYSFGNAVPRLQNYAWFADNSRSAAQPVGGKKPNLWGLYDLHGNVMEWCFDGERRYAAADATDPLGPTGPLANRVVRGGSWANAAANCRAACRVSFSPRFSSPFIGFRIARAAVR